MSSIGRVMFLHDESEVIPLEQIMLSFSVHRSKGFMISVCPVCGDVNLDRLGKVVSAGIFIV